MKWGKERKIAAGIIAAIIGFIVLVVVLTLPGGKYNIDEAVDNPPIESEETEKTVEPEPVEKPEPIEEKAVEPEPVIPTPEISVEEIYNTVELGMTEEMVRTIAGDPVISSEADTELGHAKNLIYSNGDGSVDNVTVSVQDGRVALVVLGIFDADGNLAVQSKM
jgi:hypothetical protein